ncbi:hypothetical protein ABPG72_013879 [Tetrahymena utriculariae]
MSPIEQQQNRCQNQENIENPFEFSYDVKTYIISLKIIDQLIEISVILNEQTQFQQKDIQLTIKVIMCQINTNQLVVKLCEKISGIETKTNQFEQLINDQRIQTEQIKDYLSQQMEQMKNFLVDQISALKIEHSNQIQEIKKDINQMQDKIQFNNIFLKEELEMIKQWIELQKIKDLDCMMIFKLKIMGSNYLAQNPNNIFLFSLDLKKKYTSNEINYKYTFLSQNNYLAVGCGYDIIFYTNSNTTKDSQADCKNFGKKEGMNQLDLNGGVEYFTKSQVEIFEIIDA